MIHLNGNYLDDIKTRNYQRIMCKKDHLQPNQLAMHLTFTDVWLGNFTEKQSRIATITSGDRLTIAVDGCENQNG